MSLRLPEHWLWDFWFAQSGDDVHVYFLYAPRSLGDPELRHRNARIGHAVSRDLSRWEILPDPIGPGAPGSFDELATWTGCVVEHEGRWYLFYTGVSTQDDGAAQRIGVATSDDLLSWDKRDLVFEADPRWYEVQAWRDPWVFFDDDTRAWHMLICARANHGPADGRGVIGHATADDPLQWKAQPPISRPGEFRQLEVPQLVRIGAKWRVVFCAGSGDHSAARLARPGIAAESGTHCLIADEKLGEYRLDSDRFLVGDPGGRLYAGRFLRHQGNWHFFAWEQFDEEGRFVGALTDPMPVTLSDGAITVHRPPAGHDR